MNRFVIIALALASLTCDEVSDDPHDRHFNIQFRYGVGARNELNTFENSYTKDLIVNGTVTIRLVLLPDDFYAIQGKLQSLDFYAFPDTFRVAQRDSTQILYQPFCTYIFRVQYGARFKTLFWADSVMPQSNTVDDVRRNKLHEIVRFIVELLSYKPEIQNLPPARGNYL